MKVCNPPQADCVALYLEFIRRTIRTPLSSEFARLKLELCTLSSQFFLRDRHDDLLKKIEK
jgi:hypothetical protein